MNRSVLVVVSVVLVGAGIALYFLVGKGESATTSGTGTTPSGGTVSAGGMGNTGGGGMVNTGGGDRPRMPDGTPIARAGEPGGPPPVGMGSQAPTITTRDRGTAGPTPDTQGSAGGEGVDAYKVGNIDVRDHRGGSGAQLDIPVPVHTPEGPRIDSAVTAAIGKQVRMTMYDCAKTLGSEGRGTRPRVEGQLVTNIKGNTMTVASAIMQPRDLNEADTKALKACMEPKVVGMSTPAPNQADLDSYPLSLTMPLPSK